MTTNDNFYNKLDKICRICLQESSIMSLIFEKKDEEIDTFSTLADKIMSIAQVQMTENDGLPLVICQSCQLQVDKLHDFKVLVEISDHTLRSYLQSTEDDEDETKVKMERFDGEIEDRNFMAESILENNLQEVNAIIVPTDDGMQIWKICDLNKGGSEEDESRYNDENEIPVEHIDEMDVEEVEKEITNMNIAINDLNEKKTKVKRCLKCSLCNRFFASCNDLVTHVLKHKRDGVEIAKENNDISCQVCGEKFLSLKDLKVHITDHFFKRKKNISDENTVQQIIKQDENVDKTLPERLRPESENSEKGNEKYYCSQCQEEFPTMEKCTEHIRNHLPIKKFKCKFCGKKFPRNSSRKRHEASHELVKKFDCPKCGKVFQKKSELRYHKGCHVESPLICKVCNKHFHNSQSLKMHLKRHVASGKYNCPTCGKSYYTNSELTRHIQMHLGKRDYPCPLCDMSFFSKPELNRHCKYHKGDKKFQCEICSKSYFESGHLKVHMRIHTGEKPFICNICFKAFITKSKLVRHEKIHFKDNPTNTSHEVSDNGNKSVTDYDYN